MDDKVNLAFGDLPGWVGTFQGTILSCDYGRAYAANHFVYS
jgi:hypothetical protein